jgi:hypothetical protein
MQANEDNKKKQTGTMVQKNRERAAAGLKAKMRGQEEMACD